MYARDLELDQIREIFWDFKGQRGISKDYYLLIWFHWKHKKYTNFQKQETSVKKETLLFFYCPQLNISHWIFFFLRLFYQSPKKGNSYSMHPPWPCKTPPSSHKFRNTRKFKVANLKNERDVRRT